MSTIPLTPAAGGGMCISDAALAVADIIVSTTSASVSGVIRAATFSSVSHAMVYGGHKKFVETVGDRHRIHRSKLGGGVRMSC